MMAEGANSDQDNGLMVSLKKRKQALEESLQLKTLQLKSLCLKEAEMTGELPPETPLEPGEPIPYIRKRVGAEFNINQSLLHKAKSSDEAKLGKLELELELQRKIVKANLKLSSEVKLKRSVRKKRLQNYQDAIHKLKELERKWLLAKQLMEVEPNIYESDGIDRFPNDINYLHSQKIGTLVSSRPKSSLALPGESDAEQVDGSIDIITSKSAPSTPRVPRHRNIHHQITRTGSPQHNIRDFKSISANSGHFDPIRPSSVHFPFDKDSDENEPERCRTAEHFSREFDAESCSLGSGSSVDSNILRFTNGSKRKNILSLLHPIGSRNYFDINSHLYTLPSDRGILTSSSEILRRTGDRLHDSNTTLPSKSSTLSINSYEFTRHNSLERSRRRSYGNLTQSRMIEEKYDDHLYQNQDSLTDLLISKSQTSLPPPPDILPTSASSRSHLSSPPPINMASRPLPSPPASSPVSSPPSNSPSPSPSTQPPYTLCINHQPHSYVNQRNHFQQQRPQSHPDHHSYQVHIPQPNEISYIPKPDDMYQNVTDVKKINERMPDITSRAVRSSIIRTPAAVSGSASSNDLTALCHPQTQPPSMHPLRCQDPLSLIMPSANDDITYTARSITIPPDSDLTPPSRSVMSPAKKWSETDLDACSSSKSSGGKKSGKVTPASSCITTSSSSNASTTSSQKFFDPSEFDTAFIHQSSEEVDDVDVAVSRSQLQPTGKTRPSRASSHPPPSIPLSPNLPPPSNGLEVNILSVGHFQPYWEETKPYELSDFFKYSAKHRRKVPASQTLASTENKSENSNYVNSVREANAKMESNGENKLKKAQENNINPSKSSDENTNWYENDVKRPTIV